MNRKICSTPIIAKYNMKKKDIIFNDNMLYGDDFFTHDVSMFETLKKFYPEPLNKDMFRSKEFTKTHNGLHILFNGCSVTAGVGLLEEEIWAKKVFNRINETEKCSGFFNLAVGGSSHFTQTANMFKYFKKYGNPDIIFFNLTSFDRFYNYSHDYTGILESSYNNESAMLLNFFAYQYYEFLEQYCRSNKILLISFSWNSDTNDFMINKTKTFYKTDLLDSYKYIEKCAKDNKEYIEVARDGSHYGVGFHEYWSDTIYNIYKTLQVAK